jgi:hypothetical protein
MDNKKLLFFADGSQETGSFLTDILDRQGSAGILLSSFLHGTLQALKDERGRLPCHVRKHLPDIIDLRCILQPSSPGGHRHTALHSVEVVLAQLAHFIA